MATGARTRAPAIVLSSRTTRRGRGGRRRARRERGHAVLDVEDAARRVGEAGQRQGEADRAEGAGAEDLITEGGLQGRADLDGGGQRAAQGQGALDSVVDGAAEAAPLAGGHGGDRRYPGGREEIGAELPVPRGSGEMDPRRRARARAPETGAIFSAETNDMPGT